MEMRVGARVKIDGAVRSEDKVGEPGTVVPTLVLRD